MESNMSNATAGVILIVVVVFLMTTLLPNGPSHQEGNRRVGDHWIYPVNMALNGCLWMMAAIFVFFLIAGHALGLK
jgi:hypothetical protein